MQQPKGRVPGRFSLIQTLFKKEMLLGLRSHSLYVLIGLPVVISLSIRALAGGAAMKPPKLAVVGSGKPQILSLIKSWPDKKMPVRLVTVNSESQGRSMLKKGKLNGLLVLPPGFDEQVAAGKRPKAILYFDESRGTASFSLRPILRELFRIQARQLDPVQLQVVGIRRISLWESMLPAWVVMVLLSVLTLMPSGIGTERQAKTLEAVLVTPVGWWDWLAAKALYGITVAGTGGLLVLWANGVRGMNMPLVALAILLGAGVSTLAGLLIGLLFESPQAASAASSIIYIPLLLGAFFGDKSGWMGAASKWTPSHALVQVLSDALFVGMDWEEALSPILILTTSVILLALASVWALRREERRV